MTTYYVSSQIGNDNNAGTSSSAPFASLQVAANHTHPGDTVMVMNGTYRGGAPGGGVTVNITTSGTASAPITYQAMSGQTPVIDSSDGWHGILISASYIIVDGFTVVGNAATITLADAQAHSGPNSPHYDGNGISVDTSTTALPHHITIQNNTVYNEPGGGIVTGGADYIQVLNNTVHDNAHWSAYGASGISIVGSRNFDTAAGFHMIVDGNTVYNNSELVNEYRAQAITDGEGIILDSNTNQGYTGAMLVQNNLVYSNGSAGIETYLTDNATITHNTVYRNNTVGVQSDPNNYQIFINQSNDTVFDNNFSPNDHTPPNPPVITSDTVDAQTVTLFGTAEANSTIKVYDNNTQLPGSSTTDASGHWTFNTGGLAPGSQSFTATATDAGLNTSQPSSPFVVVVSASSQLVADGSFENGLNGWTLSGNSGGGQIVIDNTAEAGSFALNMGSIGTDGIISQTIATTPGQQYTFSFWLRNAGGTPNDFTAKWNGQAVYSVTNAPTQSYTQHTFTVTATGSSTVLEFDARQDPSHWNLDNISVVSTGGGGDTTPPTVASVVASGTGITNGSGNLNAGDVVTLTVNMSEPTTVAGGTPSLTLNDGGSATYQSGSGTAALAFSYTVAAGQNTSDLALTTFNANGATLRDAAGNNANMSAVVTNPAGTLRIDTTAPSVASVTTSGAGITNGTGVVHQGAVVTLTVNTSEAVTVSGGTPSLTLNDGGTATYQSGSGSSALAFSYTVAAGLNTPDLTVTAFNANSATITDGAGNPANMTGAVTNPAGTLQVDTTNPDPDSGPEIPILTIGSHALTLPAQGSVSLPISVAAVDSDDMISVRISGLTRYESITDNLDNITFRPKHGSVTLTAAQVNSGLTLNSTYRGSGHPVNTLTVTATNSTAGETGTSAAQTITITDPPANSSGSVDEIAPAFAQTAAALLAQFGAAGFQGGTNSGGPIGAPPQAHLTEDTSFLTKPHP